MVDFDVVDFTNLQRQVIHGTKDVGRKKLDSAAETMHDINPYVEIDKHETALTSENALDILKDYDLVVDGTDNFPTRYLVNDACVLLGKPNVYGSIFRFEGPGDGVRLRGRPVLSLPVSRTATSGPGAELRRRRRAGNSARHDRPDSGDRDREADSGNRRAAGGPAAALRRARNAVPRAEAAQESRVPGLRRSSDDHEADRLSSVLRRSAAETAARGCDRRRNRRQRK